MSKWMSEWMNEQMDERAGKQTNKQMNEVKGFMNNGLTFVLLFLSVVGGLGQHSL